MVLVIYLGFSIYHRIQYWKYEFNLYEVSDFKANKKSFEKIAEKLLVCFDEEYEKNNELEYIVVNHTPLDNLELECFIDYEHIDGYVATRGVSQQEKEAYSVIHKSFSKKAGGLYFIKVLHDRVIFAAERGPCAVVYMKNGNTPDYPISKEGTFASFYADKISLKWYQIVWK